MQDEIIDKINNYIQQRSLLYFPERKRNFFKLRVLERMSKIQITNLSEYFHELTNSPTETLKLIDFLTVNETFFLRNNAQFNYLRNNIIPELEVIKGSEMIQSWNNVIPISPKSIMRLRVLCAGCSTGEEPYSIAMTLLETLSYPKAWNIEIIAGDISENCLNYASRGYYESEKLRKVPRHLIDKYFEPSTDGYFVNTTVKSLIRFVSLNLHDVLNSDKSSDSEFTENSFDIIFCRNVMIYFCSEVQQKLVNKLYTLLVNGGYLFTGDAEPLHLFEHSFKLVDDDTSLIYQKVLSGAHINAV